MVFRSLGEFLTALEARGELRRITAEVDARLEISEIAARVMKAGGPALVFENVRGYSYPVVINLMGTEARMAMALAAASLDEKAREIEDLLAWLWRQARSFSLLRTLPEALPRLPLARALIPRRLKRAPCQEVISDTEGFSSLPVLTCWPQDGGPFLTLPLVCTRDPDTGAQNVGMYRLQVYDDRTSGMHWHLHKDGARIFEAYRKRGARMPVSVALGGDPATIYASTAPLPPGVWELSFAGFLRGEPVEVVSSTLSDIEVPAHAEIVLEGYVDPREPLRMEGPFGDHTGFYSLPAPYPVFHLERITRRKHPLYPATVVGRPPKEDCWMAKATERLFLPLLRQLCPEIVDINMPLEGVFHNCLLVSVRKPYPGAARKVMHFLWGMGQLANTKLIVAVDEEVDVKDVSEVAWRAFNNVDARRDLVFSEGPLDDLDHSSPLARYGTRLGIDATRKGPEEGHGRDWPDPLVMDPEVQRLVTERWSEYGLA